MTPHSHLSPRVTTLVRARRLAVAVAATTVLAGLPAGAHALTAPRVVDLTAASEAASAVADAVEPATPSVESPLDEVVRILTDTYAWDERGPRIEALQFVLGVKVDGWYAHQTVRAHRAALDAAWLPTEQLPVAPVPAGPSPSQWAALRECESNGNYRITNPSGKYRGAYQFDRSTWNSVASRHAPHLVGVDPAAAAPADQDAMALALYGERGWRPWPHCGRHLR